MSGSTKAQKELGKVLADPVEEFRRQIRDMLKRNSLYWDDLGNNGRLSEMLSHHCSISLEDAERLTLSDNTIDLLVTSPPYATCYEYKDIHQLTQLWFEQYGLLAPEDAKEGWIGSSGVSHRAMSETGASSHTGSYIADASLAELAQLAEGNISQRVKREVRALHYYFQDMSSALRELVRVTAPGKYLVLIVGDSYRRGVTIPTSEALREMALQQGMELERKIVRKIPVRVLVSTRDKRTGRFSSTAQSDISVYPEESILIFKKGPLCRISSL